MSGMLASVNSLQEALLVQSFQVDVIDLKQPAEGALGALPVSEVKNIVDNINGAVPVSATVGDLPMQADLIATAVRAMAATGVDFVKIGFFPGGDWQACIAELAEIAKQQTLIAVLFADTRPDFAVIEALQAAGFAGVMLDTRDKNLGSLTRLMCLEELQAFVERAQNAGLLTGLAGSLRADDVPALLPLGADYLGFRGALCSQHNRVAALDAELIAELRGLMGDRPVSFERLKRAAACL